MIRRAFLVLAVALLCVAARAEDSFSFAVTSDHFEDLPGGLVQGLTAAKPKFVVFTGDMVMSSNARDFKGLTRDLLDPLKKAGIDWYPVLGNHDFPCEPGWKQLWGEEKGKPYYSFDSGPAHVIVLDSNKLAYGNRKFKEGSQEAAIVTQGKDLAKGSEQYNWLVEDLEKTKQKFIFVFYHEPAMSFANHGASPAIQATLCPLFEKHKVTAVFSGHDHTYQRFVPIRMDVTDENKPKPVADPANGVVYFVTGSGPNGKCYELTANPLHAAQKQAASFTIVTIEGDTAKGKGVALPSQEVIDTFEIKSKR
jgi:3',5'-cyclic AMP phosphodiesterase CpdA